MKIGKKIYYIYNDESIIIDKVSCVGNDFCAIESYGYNMELFKFYYSDYDKKWFTNLEKAKRELRKRHDKKIKIKIAQRNIVHYLFPDVKENRKYIEDRYRNNNQYEYSIEHRMEKYRRIEYNNNKWFSWYIHYDENDRIVYEGNHKDRGVYRVYDDKGNEIYLYSANGNTHSQEHIYKYDNLNRKTYDRYKSGDHITIDKYEYDDRGNVIYEYKYNNSTGSYYRDIEYWYKYDKNGNMIYSKTYGKWGSDGLVENFEEFCEYDENDDLVYSKTIDIDEEKGEKRISEFKNGEKCVKIEKI